MPCHRPNRIVCGHLVPAYIWWKRGGSFTKLLHTHISCEIARGSCLQQILPLLAELRGGNLVGNVEALTQVC